MEDTSMCPGSVRSLPLLGFTIFLISLHVPQLDSVSFKVIGPDRPIRALVGEDALLACHLSPRMSAESMEVRWFRSTFSAIVHLYRDGRDQVGQQIAPYRSRTKLLKDSIANGTVSLRIHNITPSDEGTYGCLFQLPTFYEEAVLELEVAGLGSTPHLSVDGYQHGGIHVVCESAGWYPEPQVLWRDLRGQQLAPVMEKISQRADGLFDTHIAAVITDSSNQNLSCSVLNPRLGQEKTAKMHIADVFLPRTNPYKVALSVTLAGVFLLVLLSGYCFWKQNRGKDAQQAELKKKIQKSLPELGWSKVSKNSAMVILDPDTAHPSLLVSENRRSVKLRGLQQDVPDNPERFDRETCVLGLEGFTSGQHYWEVAFGGGRIWAVGVARESVRRKGWINFSPEEMIWAMDQCGGHFRACTSPDILLPLTVSPGRIGVYLDYEQGRVSFYQPGMEAPIYIFTTSFTRKLHPFFWVYTPITLCP
ncbi:butyrophilin subfamily 1 member A1-like [Mauremys reevesii]|uniref:butyrophilin subfamily 1 member A1-like n=1 Tax=Mauremys reevesii TaxID=260615 RepID=UPI00193FDE86|nr:butyrophilin subfamily 1 member A1-like [Mauremys reevesii]XP_039374232.1 butyrophilin subfamily 1 member A1-like [Mauremys reevesii]XP_039374233.1 butyrophilin subfamily 1 member A1-like [Mauremys reevesii]XP_039374234.1 butyrophilin subfamily 1 member A1-like [Mauremys reevesii]XP_039374235.1 butyrophilin subfamily 1 member A1-like [Mauremys reevesii]